MKTLAEKYKQDQVIKADLRATIKSLEIDVEVMRDDRRKFQDHFERRFKWWFELIRSGSTPDLVWLAKDDALWLRRFKYWTLT